MAGRGPRGCPAHSVGLSGSLMPESGTIERLPLGTQEVTTRGEKRT